VAFAWLSTGLKTLVIDNVILMHCSLRSAAYQTKPELNDILNDTIHPLSNEFVDYRLVDTKGLKGLIYLTKGLFYMSRPRHEYSGARKNGILVMLAHLFTKDTKSKKRRQRRPCQTSVQNSCGRSPDGFGFLGSFHHHFVIVASTIIVHHPP
jgi:hypothetical protein